MNDDFTDIYLALKMQAADEHMNFLANCDPTDPVVAEAHEKITKLRSTAKEGVIQTCWLLEGGILLVLAYLDLLDFWFLPTLFLVLVAWGAYSVSVGAAEGDIAHQAAGKMQFRQSYDIHTMLLQSIADRQPYQAAPPPVDTTNLPTKRDMP